MKKRQNEFFEVEERRKSGNLLILGIMIVTFLLTGVFYASKTQNTDLEASSGVKSAASQTALLHDAL